MKATGIVRRIDDLGRVVIPKEIRRTLRIKEGTPLEIFTDREGEIILKKYSPIGELSLFAKEYAESLSHSTGMLSCITDHDQVVAAAGPGSKEFISDENLFNYQAKVVNDLAEKESYVIVGRCVNYVFKDRPNTLRVFIHAPWEFRVEQASQKISGSREDVEKFLLKDDKRKQDYYRKFAGGQWSDATNYDLCLNSGKLGFDKCVDAIETQLKIMLGK